jgi:putative two-component system response regulator
MDNLRILIVDTSVAMRRGIKALLDSLEADFAEASNGQDGLRIAREESFDLIISGVDMPKMSGLDLCQQLRKTSDTQDIPIIILSSSDAPETMDQAIQVGASAYIPKREARTRLYDTVQDLLSASSAPFSPTILIVDDSRPIRNLVQNGLKEAGFQTLLAENGKEALRLLNRQQPDLIVSDINMPEMDGVELCRAIHADPQLAALPFVVISSIKDREQMRQILKEGASDYVVKPFNIDQLVIHIERFLADRRSLAQKEREQHESQEVMFQGCINMLLAVLQARDPRLYDHAEAVARLAGEVATFMGASQAEVAIVTSGARLHDIGKIGLPDHLLFPADSLSTQEMAAFQQHPRIGADILKNLPNLPSEIVSVVLLHHERPDGKGYPRGLPAEQIPKWAGITAVADTYYYLLHTPVSGKPVSSEAALEKLEDLSGTVLCSEYVYPFLDWMNLKKDHS